MKALKTFWSQKIRAMENTLGNLYKNNYNYKNKLIDKNLSKLSIEYRSILIVKLMTMSNKIQHDLIKFIVFFGRF